MIFKRNCGLFSNINVFQKTYSLNYNDELQFILTEYYNDLDLYPLLFEKNNNIQISTEDLNYINENCTCLAEGLFDKYVDLKIVNKVKDKYFNLSKSVISKYNELKLLIPEKYLFIWYRFTDKITESTRPDYESFFNFVKSKNIDNLKVVIRTDSLSFLEEAKKQLDCICLPHLPLSESALHLNQNEINDSDFYNKNQIFKFQDLQRMLAVTKIASESEIYIATNSNINTFVIQQRNNFDNVYVFKDEINLINYANNT